MRNAGRGPRTDPWGIHYNILSMVCEVVSNPLHKIDIQANGLQFFNLGLWGTESNGEVKNHSSCFYSRLHHLQSVICSCQKCLYCRFSRTESPLTLQERVSRLEMHQNLAMDVPPQDFTGDREQRNRSVVLCISLRYHRGSVVLVTTHHILLVLV